MPRSRLTDSGRLRLSVSLAAATEETRVPPVVPWPAAAVGGGVFAGLSGLLVLTGVVFVAWFSAAAIPLPTMFSFAAQMWLLANGGPVGLGAEPVSLVPLGLTLLFAATCAAMGAFANRQGVRSRSGGIDAEMSRRIRYGSALQVSLGYTGFAVLVTSTVGGGWRPVLGAFGVSLAGALAGVAPRPEQLPRLLRRGLVGATVGALALLAASATALLVAVMIGEQRVNALETSLGLDGSGVLVWGAVTLAYLPNLLVWALAWLLGGGVVVGTGSLVSLWATRVGLLPAIPVLGALPEPGVGPWWLLGLLATGVIAGGVAGAVAVGRRPHSALAALGASGIAGIALSVSTLGLAAASRGGLGSLRMSELGPRVFETAAIGGSLLLVGSLLAGMFTWLVGSYRRSKRRPMRDSRLADQSSR